MLDGEPFVGLPQCDAHRNRPEHLRGQGKDYFFSFRILAPAIMPLEKH